MRIATFNLENLELGPDAAIPLETRIPILRPQLERLRADILCLQEINSQRMAGHPMRELLALDNLIEGTRYQGYARASSTPSGRVGPADVHNQVERGRLEKNIGLSQLGLNERAIVIIQQDFMRNKAQMRIYALFGSQARHDALALGIKQQDQVAELRFTHG